MNKVGHECKDNTIFKNPTLYSFDVHLVVDSRNQCNYVNFKKATKGTHYAATLDCHISVVWVIAHVQLGNTSVVFLKFRNTQNSILAYILLCCYCLGHFDVRACFLYGALIKASFNCPAGTNTETVD